MHKIVNWIIQSILIVDFNRFDQKDNMVFCMH
jgi:hypothetical protein